MKLSWIMHNMMDIHLKLNQYCVVYSWVVYSWVVWNNHVFFFLLFFLSFLWVYYCYIWLNHVIILLLLLWWYNQFKMAGNFLCGGRWLGGIGGKLISNISISFSQAFSVAFLYYSYVIPCWVKLDCRSKRFITKLDYFRSFIIILELPMTCS